MSGNIYLQSGTTTATETSGGGLSSGATVIANASASLNNSSALDEYTSAMLTASYSSAPVEGDVISLYLVPVLGGNNATVDTSGTMPVNYLVGNFIIPSTATSTTLYMAIDGIPLMAQNYWPYIQNNTTQNISSGWTLTFYGTQHQYT